MTIDSALHALSSSKDHVYYLYLVPKSYMFLLSVQFFADRSCQNDIKGFIVVCKCGEWQGSLDDWEVCVHVCVCMCLCVCVSVYVCLSSPVLLHNEVA